MPCDINTTAFKCYLLSKEKRHNKAQLVVTIDPVQADYPAALDGVANFGRGGGRGRGRPGLPGGVRGRRMNGPDMLFRAIWHVGIQGVVPLATHSVRQGLPILLKGC